MSDYCYSDRLHSRSYDLYLQPKTFRFCLLRHNHPAVPLFPSFDRTFQDEVSFRHWVLIPRRVSASLSVQFGAEALLFPEAL
jgi:hypothetical protein